MNIKAIACKVFQPELEYILKERGMSIEVEYLEIELHNVPGSMKETIQAAIKNSSDNYDAILLFYGLCGNGLAGIRAESIPLYVPRAHDCSQILLGSYERHKEIFGPNPSRSWSSAGYLAAPKVDWIHSPMGYKLNDLINEYGEENGRYLFETLNVHSDPVSYYLDIPEVRDEAKYKELKESITTDGRTLEVLQGDLSLLKALVSLESHPEILLVPPGEEITPSYDKKTLISKEVK